MKESIYRYLWPGVGRILLTGLALGSVGAAVTSSSAANGGNDGRFPFQGIVLMGDLTSEARAAIETGRVQSVTAIDAQANPDVLGGVRMFRDERPKNFGQVFLRIVQGEDKVSFGLGNDPAAMADAYHNLVIAPAIAQLGDDRALVDYIVDSPNENNDGKGPSWNTAEGVNWWARFYHQLVMRNHSLGMESCASSIPVGNIPGRTPDEIGETFFPYVGMIKDLAGRGIKPVALCCHEYKVLDRGIAERDTSLHFAAIDAYLQKQLPPGVDYVWIFPETGITNAQGGVNDGPLASPSGQTDLMAWLKQNDTFIKQWNEEHPARGRILAATMYKSGDGRQWPSFSLDPLLSGFYDP